METLSKNQLAQINGGGYAKLVSFIKDYVWGKGIDWVLDHKDQIWQNFKNGPGANDPMNHTDYVRILGHMQP